MFPVIAHWKSTLRTKTLRCACFAFAYFANVHVANRVILVLFGFLPGMKMQKSVKRRIYPQINPLIFAYLRKPRIRLSLFKRQKIRKFYYLFELY